MELNNNTRARHTKFMQYVLTLLNVKNNTGQPLKLLTRIGSTRSADGIVFDIGNGKVAKCIFNGRGGMNVNMIRREYDIGKRMSDAGIGPKMYGMTEFSLKDSIINLKNQAGPSLWPNNAKMSNILLNHYVKNLGFNRNQVMSNIKEHLPTLRNTKSFSFNLFQNWFNTKNENYSGVKSGAIIIMENIYNGPGVATAMTLDDYIKKGNPFPVNEVVKTMKKMHSINIVHRNFHAGNIMIQIKTNGSIRVVIIDFGKSKYPAQQNNNRLNSSMLKNYAKNKGISINAALASSN